MPKLTPDQQQELHELKEHPGIKALALEIENALERIKADVLTGHLGASPTSAEEEKKLIYRKLEAQGAERLYKSFVMIFNPPKLKDKK